MEKLTADYRENIRRVDRALRVGESFDIIRRTVAMGDGEMTMYAVDGFIENGAMGKLLNFFLSQKEVLPPEVARGRVGAEWFNSHRLPAAEGDVTDDPAKMQGMLLAGAVLLIGEGFGDCGIVVDLRSYPARGVGEPENDRVMLGSRDGFVETLIFNTALIRRRIRDPALTMQYLTVGSETRNDLVLCFMEGKADPGYVEKLKKRLENIRTPSLVMGHEALAEMLIPNRWYNPFPKIRYTERPDTAAAQLIEGSVLILCDTSPEVMILPTSIFDFLQETNDFYLPPLTGTYIRFVRHIVFWATLLITPLWLLMVQNPGAVPEFLHFALPAEGGKVPVFWQLLLVEFLIDGLRMASMNTPDMLSNSLSVVGGLILGDFAVDVGWLTPEVIVCMAFVAIANFTQRSYQLGYAFKFFRILLLILVNFLGVWGFGIGIAVLLLLLATNSNINFGRSYLYPLIPFDGRALLSLFFRVKKRSPPQGSGKEEKKR